MVKIKYIQIITNHVGWNTIITNNCAEFNQPAFHSNRQRCNNPTIIC